MARLVVLDRKLKQKHIEITDNIPDTIDIISPQKTNFEIRLNKDISVGDLVFVSKEDNDYLGIISEIKNENTSTLYTYPLISITDVPVILSDINGDVFTWIKNTLETNFIISSDPLFNLALTIQNRAITSVSLKHSFESNNLFDALITIFKKTGIYLDFSLTFDNSGRPTTILCEVYNNNDEDVINMREDNPLMIKQPVYNFDYSGTNKVIYKVGSETITRYLLKNNTISEDENSSLRIYPIVQEIMETDAETEIEDIENSAKELMLGNINQFNIQLQIKGNPNYPLTPFRKFNLITAESTYETYITKVVNHNDEYYDIVLGVVRNTLTDKLKEVSKGKTSVSKSSSGGGSSVGVVDSLTSTSTTEALSANQGRVLKEFTDNAFTQVNINSQTGLFTFTRQDGTIVNIDTLLEKVVINFDYDESTQELVLTLEDGTEKRVPMSAFIDDYDGVDGDIITISISNDNKISATIKNGTITLDKLTIGLQSLINQIEGKANTSDLGELAYKDSLTKSDVGLGNVDNTSDENKPISILTQQALDKKASIYLLPSNTANQWSSKTADPYNSGYINSVAINNGEFLISREYSPILWKTRDFETFTGFANTEFDYIFDMIYYGGNWFVLGFSTQLQSLRLFYINDSGSTSNVFSLIQTNDFSIQRVTCFRRIGDYLFIGITLGSTNYSFIVNLPEKTSTRITLKSDYYGSIYDVVELNGVYYFLGSRMAFYTSNLSTFSYFSIGIGMGTNSRATMLYENGQFIVSVGYAWGTQDTSTSYIYTGRTLSALSPIDTGFYYKGYMLEYNLGAYLMSSFKMNNVIISQDLETFEEIPIPNGTNSFRPLKLIYENGQYWLIGYSSNNSPNLISTSIITTFASANAENLTEKDVDSWKEKLGVGEGGTKVIFAYYD